MSASRKKWSPYSRNKFRGLPGDIRISFEMLWTSRRSFDLTLNQAGLEKKTPQGKLTIHSFRATYLTKMGEILNNNAWLLKEVAGHKNIKTTQTYCQPTAPVVPISMLSLMPKTPAKVHDSGQMGVSDGCQSRKNTKKKAI